MLKTGFTTLKQPTVCFVAAWSKPDWQYCALSQ